MGNRRTFSARTLRIFFETGCYADGNGQNTALNIVSNILLSSLHNAVPVPIKAGPDLPVGVRCDLVNRREICDLIMAGRSPKEFRPANEAFFPVLVQCDNENRAGAVIVAVPPHVGDELIPRFRLPVRFDVKQTVKNGDLPASIEKRIDTSTGMSDVRVIGEDA